MAWFLQDLSEHSEPDRPDAGRDRLRPAQDTCEERHWPSKFWGAQSKTFTHFGSDEQNTPRAITLLMKVGGGDPALGVAGGGIHWHMNIANKIEYYASDERAQASLSLLNWRKRVRVESAHKRKFNNLQVSG
jgi:hypothetical protein